MFQVLWFCRRRLCWRNFDLNRVWLKFLYFLSLHLFRQRPLSGYKHLCCIFCHASILVGALKVLKLLILQIIHYVETMFSLNFRFFNFRAGFKFRELNVTKLGNSQPFPHFFGKHQWPVKFHQACGSSLAALCCSSSIWQWRRFYANGGLSFGNDFWCCLIYL